MREHGAQGPGGQIHGAGLREGLSAFVDGPGGRVVGVDRLQLR
jgi:hypothetical protein